MNSNRTTKMKALGLIAAGAGLLMVFAASSRAKAIQAHSVDGVAVADREALAIRYREGQSTTLGMVGTSLASGLDGKAEIKREQGRTRIKLKMSGLVNPQALGPYYTTYVVWSVSPEGQANNLAEMPFKSDSDIEVTSPLQTFALIITAEPYSAVKLPSPVVVAENVMRSGTKGVPETSRIKYRGDPGTFYAVSTADGPALMADYNTPLLVLGARRAVQVAKRAGAKEYAPDELHQAEIKLAVLEQTWPESKKADEKLGGVAREVMQLGEHARELSVERSTEAGLRAERQAAKSDIAAARSDADQAQDEAARANQQAAEYKDAMARAQQEADQARERVKEAQTDADKAKANEELARAQAEESQLEADRAKRDKEAAEQQLYVSLSQILETKREARGLVVSLSDVLFDFNKATLKPGARERLSKLAGILIAYPGQYRIEIDGFTDSIGSDDYNLKLSQGRAESVSTYLVQEGVHSDRIGQVQGMGKMMPVADNSSAEGRQMNRRVEIVISDLGGGPSTTGQ
jgi:outer membrane protein OmpA-like peptidoglycan-associated protein